MQTFIKLTVILLFISIKFQGQNSENDTLILSKVKMTFPDIHFKHNSVEYAIMPYSVDSCLKYIALNFDKNRNSLVIWRDSTEKEDLTIERIKKLKLELNKYPNTKKFKIISMGNAQKVSSNTINSISNATEKNYLLSFNSVFEISKTRLPKKKKRRLNLDFIEIGLMFGN